MLFRRTCVFVVMFAGLLITTVCVVVYSWALVDYFGVLLCLVVLICFKLCIGIVLLLTLDWLL